MLNKKKKKKFEIKFYKIEIIFFFGMKSDKVDITLIKEISPCVYEIPIGFVPNMKVPGIFYATPDIAEFAFTELKEYLKNKNSGLPSIMQIAYVATLDGIVEASYAMPDMHSGYGFSIGGVAAFDTSDPKAIISPGGVGYDINCGVRCMTTDLTLEEFLPLQKQIIDTISVFVPAGVGGKLSDYMKKSDIPQVLAKGAQWNIEKGYGIPEDLENCEENGCLKYAKPEYISERAIQRGNGQLGTLGSGNHYVEIQKVDEIFEQEAANVMGIKKDQIVIMIHTGSRGLGHQVADDFLNLMSENLSNPNLPDKQLNSPTLNSELGQKYLYSMAAAANFAWANRQLIMHNIRLALKKVFGEERPVETHLIYDVAHNIAKIEKHIINGEEKEFIVHRKGATRAFGPGRIEIPEKYREIGQPILIGGSMGTASYILLGTNESMNKSFGSTCHGAGRMMSRTKALRTISMKSVKLELESKGVILRAACKDTIQDEAPSAYKDIEQVVEACQIVGISKKVARLLPLGVIKG